MLLFTYLTSWTTVEISIKQACEPDTPAYCFYISDSFPLLTLSSNSKIFSSSSESVLVRNVSFWRPLVEKCSWCWCYWQLGCSLFREIWKMNHFSIYLRNMIWITETMWLTSCSVIRLRNWDTFLLKQTGDIKKIPDKAIKIPFLILLDGIFLFSLALIIINFQNTMD